MGRAQPHGIAGHGPTLGLHSAYTRLTFGLHSAYTRPTFGAKWPSQPREGPRMAKKVVPGRFTPNCGEGTISVGRSLGLAHEFRGWRVQCGLASDPVTGRDQVEGGHRGWWGGFRMLTDAHLLLHDAIFFVMVFYLGPPTFAVTFLLECFCRGCFGFGSGHSGHPNPFGPRGRLRSPSALRVPCVPNP